MPSLPIPQASLQAPGAPAGPQINPGSLGAGGQALAGVGAMLSAEADRRGQQRRASQAATARMTAQTRIDAFLAEMERDPNYETYPQAWQSAWEGIQADIESSVDADTLALIEPDLIALRGNGSRAVSQLGNAREDDHNVAQLITANNALLERAGTSTNPQLDRDMIRQNYYDAWQAGTISEDSMVEFIDRDVREYTYRREYVATTGAAAIGWLQGHEVDVADPNAPRGIRNNNPLNIRATGTRWNGEVEGGDTAFETFATPEHGIAAAVRNLQGYQDRHGIRTIGEAINRWAPPSDGNDTNAYLARIEEMTGLSADTPLDAHNFAQMQALIPAMIQVENGTQPYDAGTFVQGFSLAGVGGGPRSTEGWAEPTGGMTVEHQGVSGLTPEQNESLYNRALRNADRALAGQQLAIGRQIEDYQTAFALGLDADPPSESAIMGAYMTDPAQGAEIVQGLRRLDSLAGDIQGMHSMTNAEVEAMVAAEREGLTPGPGLTERAQRVQALGDAAETILAARDPNHSPAPGDPAAYVMRRDPSLAEMAESAETGEDMAAVIRATLAAQTFVDDPNDRRPLPAAMVAGVMEAYGRSEDPSERLAYLSGITTALGDDDAARLVLDQLEGAGLHPGVGMILDADVPEPQAASMLAMLDAWPAQEGEWKARAAEEDINTGDMDALVGAAYRENRGAIWDDRNAIIGADPATFQLAENERETVRRLAIGFALRESLDPEAEAEGVMDALFGNQTRAGDYPAVVRGDEDYADQVAAGMSALIPALPRLVPLETLAQYAGLPDDAPREQMESAYQEMRDAAEWVNVGDRFGIVMPVTGWGGRLLADENGPLTWTAEKLAEVGLAMEGISTSPSDMALDSLVEIIQGRLQ